MSDKATQDRLAALEAVITRSLDLLRAGLAEDAQRELACVAGGAAPPPRGGISELELEEAFEAAQPEVAQMRDADQVAHEALLATAGSDDELEADGGGSVPPSFATATMAELLESQGDVEGASRIRAGLAPPSAETPAAPARPSRHEVITTLGRWLENVRRASA